MLPALGLQALVLRPLFILFLERQLDPENVFDKPQMFTFKNGAKRTYVVTSFSNVHLTLGNSFQRSTSTASDVVLIITVTPVFECAEPSRTFTTPSILESFRQSLHIWVISLSPIYRGRNGGLDMLEPCTPDPIAQQPRRSASFLLTRLMPLPCILLPFMGFPEYPASSRSIRGQWIDGKQMKTKIQ